MKDKFYTVLKGKVFPFLVDIEMFEYSFLYFDGDNGNINKDEVLKLIDNCEIFSNYYNSISKVLKKNLCLLYFYKIISMMYNYLNIEFIKYGNIKNYNKNISIPLYIFLSFIDEWCVKYNIGLKKEGMLLNGFIKIFEKRIHKIHGKEYLT